MRRTIELINKEFIAIDNLKKALKDVADKLKFSYQNEQEYLTIFLPFESSIEIWIQSKAHFDEFATEEYYPIGYGSVMTIYYSHDDVVLIPFLKAVLSIYPEMQVFNDELSDGTYLLFNKAEIDASETVNPYPALFTTQPPTT
ncbi:MAG: hypothetical protein KA149_06530 [Chitinophagales bacterium]|nr:hypothetical protein [Chitinophagales bacterium]